MSDPDLEQFDQEFAGSEAKSGGNVKDGEYEAIVECLEKRTWKNAPQVSWRYKITGPESIGRTLFRDVEVKSDNLGYIKSDFHKVGLVDPKLSTNMANAHHVVGQKVRITVKTNARGYQNVYLDGLAGEPIANVPF